jgi:hypothetical protein
MPLFLGRRMLTALAAVAMLLNSSGCLVLGINRFADNDAVVFDEHLLGMWKDADDDVSVMIERSEWRSYRLSYVHPIATGQLTAYLFKSGGFQYLDLMPLRGDDPGVFTLPGHALVRLTLDGQTLSVAPLSYDWFRKGLAAHTAPRVLALVQNDRDQIIATATASALAMWVGMRTESDPAFGAGATFKKEQ